MYVICQKTWKIYNGLGDLRNQLNMNIELTIDENDWWCFSESKITVRPPSDIISLMISNPSLIGSRCINITFNGTIRGNTWGLKYKTNS